MSDDYRLVGKLCKKWWDVNIHADTGHARKTRAELRRANKTLAVLGVSAVHDLYRSLHDAGFKLYYQDEGPDRLALIAAALAQVKDSSGVSAPCYFGNGSPPNLSLIRFNSLIKTKQARHLIRPLVRALKIVKGAVNVNKLANDLYFWNHDQTRMQWCFDYYGATEAKPFNEQQETKA